MPSFQYQVTMLFNTPHVNTSIPDTDLKHLETLNYFPHGQICKTALSENLNSDNRGSLFGHFHHQDCTFLTRKTTLQDRLREQLRRCCHWKSEDVHWDIWVSIACAAHSGAACRIFSRRLLTWKHRDWICLSHVGRGSRAARHQTKEEESD